MSAFHLDTSCKNAVSLHILLTLTLLFTHHCRHQCELARLHVLEVQLSGVVMHLAFLAGRGAPRSPGCDSAGLCERVRPRSAGAAAGELSVLPPHAQPRGRASPRESATLPHRPLLRTWGTRCARAGRPAAARRACAR